MSSATCEPAHATNGDFDDEKNDDDGENVHDVPPWLPSAKEEQQKICLYGCGETLNRFPLLSAGKSIA